MNAIDYPARILCFQPRLLPDPTPEEFRGEIIYLEETRPNITSDDIVFYAETINGNPLDATKVVRYLLNKPLVLTNEAIKYGDTDYLLSYSKYVDPTLPQLYLMKDERSIFDKLRKITKNENQTVLYFGKTNYKQFKEQQEHFNLIKKMFPSQYKLILRTYPQNHEDTLKLIAESSYMISFDGFTNTNYEATLLGTPVLSVDNSFNTNPTQFNIPLDGLCFDEQDLAIAKLNVMKAYGTYCDYLNYQDQKIKKTIEEIIIHFQQIQNNKIYMAQVKKQNLLRPEIDQQNWKSLKNLTFKNIDYITQLPKAFHPYADKVLKRTYPKVIFVTTAKKILKATGFFKIGKILYYRVHNKRHAK